MELRTLRYFVETADTGTVSAAAQALHVTQPGLSRQLRRLEHDLGVELFDRSAGRLVLSSGGRTLLPLAREVLHRAEALRVAAAFHARGRLDRVTLGAPTTTLRDVVAPFIATLAADDPTPGVFHADGLSPADTLARGADLAVGTARARAPFRAHPLAVLPVWGYVPPGHRWAARTSVPVEELLAEPLVVPPPSFTSRQALETAVSTAGASYSSLLEAADGTLAQALAAAGRGVAVVSDDPRFDLHPLRIDVGAESLSIRLWAVWDSRHPAEATLAELARRLEDFIAARYGLRAAE